MKLINTLSGGYRRVMDTLLGLQTEMITGINAPFASLGYDLVLSGCAVTNNFNGTVNIAAGLIYVASQTLRFDGAVNIAADGSQAIVTGAVVTSTPWPFADGSTKNLYSEQKAVVGVQDITNPFQIKIGLSLYNLQQYIKDQINAAEVKGTVKTIADLDGTFGANFDVTGLGITVAWNNWALDNGNNGTTGSAGMAIVGTGVYTDPVTGLQTTYNNEDTGGAITVTLTAANIPPLRTDSPFAAGPGSAVPAIIEINDSASGLQSIGVNTGSPNTPVANMQPWIAYYRVVKIA